VMCVASPSSGRIIGIWKGDSGGALSRDVSTRKKQRLSNSVDSRDTKKRNAKRRSRQEVSQKVKSTTIEGSRGGIEENDRHNKIQGGDD